MGVLCILELKAFGFDNTKGGREMKRWLRLEEKDSRLKGREKLLLEPLTNIYGRDLGF